MAILPARRRPVTLFYAYAHEDEALRDELEAHLSLMKRNGLISEWHDRQIGAGSEWAGQIDEHLRTADVILLLVSSSFISSNYCYDVEVREAMRRHESRDAIVVPVILRSVDWHSAPFGKLQALPKDAVAITSWSNRDEAFTNVTEGIRRLIEELQSSDDDLDARFDDCIREGQTHVANREFERALASFDGGVRLKPNDPLAYFLRGYCHYKLGAYAEAIRDFIIGRRGERESQVMLLRAAAFYQLDELELAKHECERAIELDPSNAEAYILRADINIASGRPRAAHADLTQALNLAPRNALAYRKRGNLRLEMGERARAREDFRAAEECTEDDDLKQYLEHERRLLDADPLQLSNDEIVKGWNNIAALRGIDRPRLGVAPHVLGLQTREESTGSQRLWTWAELADVFSIEWVEDYVSGRDLDIDEAQRVRLAYITVAEPDRRDPVGTPAISSEVSDDLLSQAFAEVRDWVLAKSGASNRTGDIERALPRIVDVLRMREARGTHQIARIPLTSISSLPSEVSLALMFCDLAVLTEDSEHTPEEAKTQPIGVMTTPRLRVGSREGEVTSGPALFLSYELSWTDRYPTLFRDLQPLFDAGRVLYLPLPFSTFQHPEREVTLRMLGALSWLKPLVRSANSEDIARLHPLVTIDLPFISGISLEDLARVMADEQDRLAEVRVALRQAFSTARQEAAESRESLDQVFRDIVGAKVSALRRTLDRYRQKPFFQKAGGAIDEATMDVLGPLGAPERVGELLRLLYAESGKGHPTYLVNAGQQKEREEADPFHVLLRLASASNPALFVRPVLHASTLWKRPLITATSRLTIMKQTQVSRDED
jgi:tetratricopeptide (TPR) repeat protein